MNDSGSSDVKVWIYDTQAEDGRANARQVNKRKFLLKYGNDPRWAIDTSRGETPLVAPQPAQPTDPNWAMNMMGRAFPSYDAFRALTEAAVDPLLGREGAPTFGGRFTEKLNRFAAERADALKKRPAASIALQFPLAAGLAKGVGAFEPVAGNLGARLASAPAIKQGLLSAAHTAGEDTSGDPAHALASAAVAYPMGNLLGAMAAPNPEPQFQLVLRSPNGYVPMGTGEGIKNFSDLANPNALRASGAHLRYKSLNPIYSQTHVVENSFPGGRTGLGFYLNRMRGAGDEPLVSGLRTDVEEMAQQAPAIAEQASAATGKIVEAADRVPGSNFPAAPFFAEAEKRMGNIPVGAPKGIRRGLRNSLEEMRDWIDPAYQSQDVEFWGTPAHRVLATRYRPKTANVIDWDAVNAQPPPPPGQNPVPPLLRRLSEGTGATGENPPPFTPAAPPAPPPPASPEHGLIARLTRPRFPPGRLPDYTPPTEIPPASMPEVPTHEQVYSGGPPPPLGVPGGKPVTPPPGPAGPAPAAPYPTKTVELPDWEPYSVTLQAPPGPVRARPGEVRNIREGFVPLRRGTELVSNLRELGKMVPVDSPAQETLHGWQSTAKDINEWAIEQALGPEAAADYVNRKLRQAAANRLLEISGRTTERQAGQVIGGLRGTVLNAGAPTPLEIPQRGFLSQATQRFMNHLAPGEAYILDRAGAALAAEPGAGWLGRAAAVPGRLLGVGGSAPYAPLGYEIPQALPVAKAALPATSGDLLRAAALKRQQVEERMAEMREKLRRGIGW